MAAKEAITKEAVKKGIVANESRETTMAENILLDANRTIKDIPFIGHPSNGHPFASQEVDGRETLLVVEREQEHKKFIKNVDICYLLILHIIPPPPTMSPNWTIMSSIA
jgi:hypothetical protein